MSLAVPDDDELPIDGMGQPGRQLRAANGTPVTWVTNRVLGCAGLIWADLAERSTESGLQPFLLSGMDGGTERPWDTGEAVSEPEDTSVIDRIDAAQVLSGWWWHFAFSDEAHIGLRDIPGIARALVNNPFWDFWWD